MPDNFIWQSVYAVICQRQYFEANNVGTKLTSLWLVYSNSMLGALNAREGLRKRNMINTLPIAQSFLNSEVSEDWAYSSKVHGLSRRNDSRPDSTSMGSFRPDRSLLTTCYIHMMSHCRSAEVILNGVLVCWKQNRYWKRWAMYSIRLTINY